MFICHGIFFFFFGFSFAHTFLLCVTKLSLGEKNHRGYYVRAPKGLDDPSVKNLRVLCFSYSCSGFNSTEK